MDATTQLPVKRSRRAVLAAGFGAAAAAVAGALARPARTQADDGGPVLLGRSNDAASITSVRKTDADFSGNCFAAESYGTGTAVIGNGQGGIGVAGFSSVASGYGVKGENLGGTAVSGQGEAFGYGAVVGRNKFGIGVLGETHDGDTTGNYTAGVWGRDYAASKGVGTYGTAITGVGVYGRVAPTANQNFPTPPSATIGVLGEAVGAGTVAVQATNADGLALKAAGKVHFSRSGRATVGATKKSVVVSTSGVTTSSMIWAMLMNNRSGIWVRAVVPAAGSFTIYLNNTVASDTKVAWFILD